MEDYLGHIGISGANTDAGTGIFENPRSKIEGEDCSPADSMD